MRYNFIYCVDSAVFPRPIHKDPINAGGGPSFTFLVADFTAAVAS